MKPLIEFLPIKTGGCSSCGGATSQAIQNIMENKKQIFVVQILVESDDAFSITRDDLAKGKVLSTNPYHQPQTQRSITNQFQNTEGRVIPSNAGTGGNPQSYVRALNG